MLEDPTKRKGMYQPEEGLITREAVTSIGMLIVLLTVRYTHRLLKGAIWRGESTRIRKGPHLGGPSGEGPEESVE
jgi:hypothetical protein